MLHVSQFSFSGREEKITKITRKKSLVVSCKALAVTLEVLFGGSEHKVVI